MKLKTSVLLRALAVAESVHHYQKLIKCLVKRPVRPQAQICPQRRFLKKKMHIVPFASTFKERMTLSVKKFHC